MNGLCAGPRKLGAMALSMWTSILPRTAKVGRSAGPGRNFDDDAAVHRVLRRAARQPRIAGEPVHRGPGMVAGAVHGGDGADDGVLVGHARQPRHQFADVEAGHVGTDRPKLAAVIDRRIGLHVEHVGVRRPARHPDADHLPGWTIIAAFGSGGAENVEQADAAQRSTANAQEIAAIQLTKWFATDFHDAPL